MSDPAHESPLQETISLTTIGAILVALLCYGAAEVNMPVIGQCLFWIAVQVYNWFPALGRLHSPHIREETINNTSPKFYRRKLKTPKLDANASYSPVRARSWLSGRCALSPCSKLQRPN